MKEKISNESVLSVKSLMVLILCMLFCISHNVQAQSFGQIKSLAESGNVEAQFYLGNLYENGKGCEKDIHKAIFWYEKSLANGNKHVAPHLAIVYYNINEHSKAYPLFLSVASSSENIKVDDGMLGISQFFVGLYNLQGLGINKDEKSGIAWLEKAKANGDDNAFIVLGTCYLKGIGTPKNPTKSFELYKEGFERFKDKQEFAVKLAMCYLEGYGCTQDFKKVYPLIENIANGTACSLSEQWRATAQLILGVAYYKDSTIDEHYNKAFNWLTKVADSKYAIEKTKASSLYWLQRCYRFGRGVAKDVNKANELVKQYSGYDSDEPSLIELLEQK